VLVTEHVRRLAALQRRADAIGPGALLGIAEAWQQLDAVKAPLSKSRSAVSRESSTPRASVSMTLTGWPSRLSRRFRSTGRALRLSGESRSGSRT
jgi:hypothetical protein